PRFNAYSTWKSSLPASKTRTLTRSAREGASLGGASLARRVGVRNLRSGVVFLPLPDSTATSNTTLPPLCLFHGELSVKKVAIFWPGDYRARPNEWARPQISEATAQLQKALKKLGRKPYVIKGFLTRPDEAIAKLGPVEDPTIGAFVHWAYGPHTC